MRELKPKEMLIGFMSRYPWIFSGLINALIYFLSIQIADFLTFKRPIKEIFISEHINE